MANLLNFLALQLGWFACVLGAAHGHEYLGPLVVALLLAAHLARHPQRARELRLLAYVTPLGLAIDSSQVALGWIRYAGTPLLGVLAPLWIAALWPLFGTTFRASMGWLRPRRLTAGVLGAVGGPLSYLGAERLGALEILPARETSLLGLALTWGLALPVLLTLAGRGGAASDSFRTAGSESASKL